MRKMWIIDFKTSLPYSEYEFFKTANEMYAYDSFDKARKAAKRILSKYAFKKNGMFDGAGRITALVDFANYILPSMIEEDNVGLEEFDEYGHSMLLDVSDIIAKICAGEDASIIANKWKNKHYSYTRECFGFKDWEFSVKFYSDHFELKSSKAVLFDWAGINPIIGSNMVLMDDEDKHYYLYVNDLFGQKNRYNSVLFFDLQCVHMNE